MPLLGNYYMQCYMPALAPTLQSYKDSITIIKYEELVSNPQIVIENIRKASGLKLDEFNASSDWQNDSIDYNNLKQNNNAWLSDLWGKKLSNSRVGNYKKILKPEEIKLLEQVCAGPIKSFGYS